MHDGIDCDQVVRLHVPQVAADGRDMNDTLRGPEGAAGVEVDVEADDVVSPLQELGDDDRPEIAEMTGDEDAHRTPVSDDELACNETLGVARRSPRFHPPEAKDG